MVYEELEREIERVKAAMADLDPLDQEYERMAKILNSFTDRYTAIYKEANAEHKIDVEQSVESEKIKQAKSEQASRARTENRKMDVQLKIAEAEARKAELLAEQADIQDRKRRRKEIFKGVVEVLGTAVSVGGVIFAGYNCVQAGKRDKERWSQTNKDYENSCQNLFKATKI